MRRGSAVSARRGSNPGRPTRRHRRSHPRGAAGLAGLLLVLVAAFFAGAINAVAGGGSFLTFPALIFAGISPIHANATSTFALLPASLTSAVAYRGEHVPRRVWLLLGTASLLGGLLGALLLVRTRPATFSLLLPFLLLVATLLFTFGARVTAWLRGAEAHGKGLSLWVGAPVQLVVAMYGGYFGGGMGIVMLALFTVMGMSRIHQMNRLKSGLAVLLNGMAAVLFALAHAIVWREALSMAVVAVVGAYLGARGATRLDPKKVRSGVLVIAWAITAYFFAWTFVLHPIP